MLNRYSASGHTTGVPAIHSILSSCSSCHTLKGAQNDALSAKNLTHLAQTCGLKNSRPFPDPALRPSLNGALHPYAGCGPDVLLGPSQVGVGGLEAVLSSIWQSS